MSVSLTVLGQDCTSPGQCKDDPGNLEVSLLFKNTWTKTTILKSPKWEREDCIVIATKDKSLRKNTHKSRTDLLLRV